MTEERELTDAELLYMVAWITPRGPAFKLIRERYPVDWTAPAKPADKGTFFPGKLGALKDTWICKKDGKTYRACTMGQAWLDYKKTDAYKIHMQDRPSLKE